MYFWHFLLWTAVLGISGAAIFTPAWLSLEDSLNPWAKAAGIAVSIAGGIVFFGTFAWLLTGMP